MRTRSNPAPKGRLRKLPALKALAKAERESVLDLVDAIDPTSRGTYSSWILRLVLSGEVRTEDGEKLRAWLVDYGKLPKHVRARNPLSKKGVTDGARLLDLLQRHFPDDYELAVVPYGLPGADEFSGVPKPYRIVRFTGKVAIPAVQAIAKGTGWCTEGHNQAEHYLKESPLYVILKDDQPYVQAHIGLKDGLQVKDTDDVEIDFGRDPHVKGLLEGVGFFQQAVNFYAHKLANSSSGEARYSAARALGEASDPVAVPALSNALANDRSSDVRYSAARALGELGDARAVPALVSALANDENHYVRRYAAKALGKIGGARALQAIASALTNDVSDDESADVRRYAAKALGDMGDESAVPALANALANDDDSSVSLYAARAIGAIGGGSALQPLSEALHSSWCYRTRDTAAHFLGKLGDPRALPFLAEAMANDEDVGVRSTASIAFEDLSEMAAQPSGRA